MYPGPGDPDLGVFVRGLEQELTRRGHELERAVLDRRAGGKARFARLARDAALVARRFRPDVTYAHFLVPAGPVAGLASRAPLVVTAHGRDVWNVGAYPGVRTATRGVARRPAASVAGSGYLRLEREANGRESRGKTEVAGAGVELGRFAVAPAPDGPTAYRCVGWLIERKNVLRLAEAFARVGEGTLTFAGDGPLRGRLEGRPGITVLGKLPHDEIPRLVATSHVLCQPSLVEPFGLALVE